MTDWDDQMKAQLNKVKLPILKTTKQTGYLILAVKGIYDQTVFIFNIYFQRMSFMLVQECNLG